MQLAPQTVDKLQNAAGFRFHDRLHHQLAIAIPDTQLQSSEAGRSFIMH